MRTHLGHETVHVHGPDQERVCGPSVGPQAMPGSSASAPSTDDSGEPDHDYTACPEVVILGQGTDGQLGFFRAPAAATFHCGHEISSSPGRSSIPYGPVPEGESPMNRAYFALLLAALSWGLALTTADAALAEISATDLL